MRRQQRINDFDSVRIYRKYELCACEASVLIAKYFCVRGFLVYDRTPFVYFISKLCVCSVFFSLLLLHPTKSSRIKKKKTKINVLNVVLIPQLICLSFWLTLHIALFRMQTVFLLCVSGHEKCADVTAMRPISSHSIRLRIDPSQFSSY